MEQSMSYCTPEIAILAGKYNSPSQRANLTQIQLHPNACEVCRNLKKSLYRRRIGKTKQNDNCWRVAWILGQGHIFFTGERSQAVWSTSHTPCMLLLLLHAAAAAAAAAL
jgi:hypothetical protein